MLAAICEGQRKKCKESLSQRSFSVTVGSSCPKGFRIIIVRTPCEQTLNLIENQFETRSESNPPQAIAPILSTLVSNVAKSTQQPRGIYFGTWIGFNLLFLLRFTRK